MWLKYIIDATVLRLMPWEIELIRIRCVFELRYLNKATCCDSLFLELGLGVKRY